MPKKSVLNSRYGRITASTGMSVIIFSLLILTHCTQNNALTKKPTKSELAMYDALKLLDEQKYQAAITRLDDALALDSHNAGAYVDRAYIYESLDDLAKAESDLKSALSVTAIPNDITYFNLGNVYFKQAQFTNAITAYTNALQANPKHTGAWLNRANTYVHLKDYAAAATDYESFLQLLEDKQSRPEVIRMIALLKEMPVNYE
jgi:tetratricopeptide (TPR) repeat protein